MLGLEPKTIVRVEIDHDERYSRLVGINCHLIVSTSYPLSTTMLVANTSRTALQSVARPLTRSLHSSRVVRAASSSSAADEEYPAEGFGAPIWRYTIGSLVAGFGLYHLSEMYGQPKASSAVPSGDDAEVEQPWLTRYIAYWTTPTSVWRDNTAKHLG